MALAQPTGLQVQALQAPLITFEQHVEELIPARTLISFNQVVDDSAVLRPSGTLIAFTQVVDDSASLVPARELIAFQQVVDDSASLVPARTLITFEQRVRELTVIPARTLITFHQQVEEVIPARELIRFRQAVFSDAAAAVQPMRILLDGVDITPLCSQAVAINGSEGSNRTATVTIKRLPKGPLDVPSFQGRVVEIARLQNGTLAPLFHGKVDVPRYTRLPSRLTLSCSDLRNERVGQEDHERLQQMTGGLFSPITQRDDATGRQWVEELLRTVEGSLDYTGSGALRYSPWALGAPRFSLTGRDVHYREAESTFATRSSIVNKVQATIEYRWYQRNTLSHAVHLEVQRSNQCKLAGCWPAASIENEDGTLVPQVWPTRAAIRSAAESVAAWVPVALDYIEIPPDGWYRVTSDVTRKIAHGANEVIRATRCLGADVTLERYISQPQRETYALTVEAPESIAQYGAIEGNDLRFAVETKVAPEIFEARGCAIISDPDDRRSDLELALQCMQRMAAKTIREGHRGNTFAYRYKPGKGRPGRGQLLPVEIGDVIDIGATEVVARGFVTEFGHRTDEKGDAWTDIKLAISRVNPGPSVTEDWTLPAAPASYKLTPPEPGQLETPDCPAPVGEVEITGDSRLEPDGTVIIVAPAVDRSQVDEIQGTREQTYSVQIPKDQLSVEVI